MTQDDTYDHVEDLNDLPRWQWVNTEFKTVDLRKADLKYLLNIHDFMTQHEDNLLYKTTKQYEYIRDRIQVLAKRQEVARRILRRGS